jgi:hypothetical protein
MKWEIAKYVAECDTCRRVKVDHLRTARNLQHWSIPKWKWEDICMDFIVVLPHTSCGHHSIWVIVDHLMKLAHFIPVGTKCRLGNMQSYTLPILSTIMVFRRSSYLTEDLFLWHFSRNNFMNALAPILS